MKTEDHKVDLNSIPESGDIERRSDLLQLVIRDLRAEYEIAREDNGEDEDAAEINAVIDTVWFLISEAAHIAAHGINFKSKKDFSIFIRKITQHAIDKSEDCAHVVQPEITKEQQKLLS